MKLFYILNGQGEPEAVTDVAEWGKWFETADSQLALDDVGPSRISTIFLALDHSHGFGPTPILWETMVFGGPLDQEQRRYATKDEALAGHADLVQQLRGMLS